MIIAAPAIEVPQPKGEYHKTPAPSLPDPGSTSSQQASVLPAVHSTSAGIRLHRPGTETPPAITKLGSPSTSQLTCWCSPEPCVTLSLAQAVAAVGGGNVPSFCPRHPSRECSKTLLAGGCHPPSTHLLGPLQPPAHACAAVRPPRPTAWARPGTSAWIPRFSGIPNYLRGNKVKNRCCRVACCN